MDEYIRTIKPFEELCIGDYIRVPTKSHSIWIYVTDIDDSHSEILKNDVEYRDDDLSIEFNFGLFLNAEYLMTYWKKNGYIIDPPKFVVKGIPIIGAANRIFNYPNTVILEIKQNEFVRQMTTEYLAKMNKTEE